MEPSHDRVHHAIELAMQGKLGEAQSVLDERDDALAAQLRAFFAQLQRRDGERSSAMAQARHDLGNALSIAQASVEAMLDGIVQITNPRLNRIRDILVSIGDAVYALTIDGATASRVVPARDDSHLGDPIGAEVRMLTAIAETKGITLSYEPGSESAGRRAFRGNGEAARRLLRSLLLHALRYTSSEGSLRVACSPDGVLTLRADSSVISRLLEAFDGAARVVAEDGGETTVLITL